MFSYVMYVASEISAWKDGHRSSKAELGCCWRGAWAAAALVEGASEAASSSALGRRIREKCGACHSGRMREPKLWQRCARLCTRLHQLCSGIHPGVEQLKVLTSGHAQLRLEPAFLPASTTTATVCTLITKHASFSVASLCASTESAPYQPQF